MRGFGALAVGNYRTGLRANPVRPSWETWVIGNDRGDGRGARAIAGEWVPDEYLFPGLSASTAYVLREHY